MKAIDLYAYFRALERYFRGNETYEIKAINVDSFKNLPDLARWERLAGKREAKNYVLANVLNNNWSLREFNDPTYLEWCRVNENLYYNFKSDVETIYERGPTTNLLKLRLDYKVSRETLIVLCQLAKPNLIEELWSTHKDNMVRSEGILLKKYTPIFLYNMAFASKEQKYKTAFIEVAKSAK